MNVCGVNHFNATNTKVGKNYQKVNATCFKKGELVTNGGTGRK